MTTSISSLFKAGLFHMYDFVVSQLTPLTSKATSFKISKMWSFFTFKIDRDIRKFSRFQLNKDQHMLNISVHFKDTKKAAHILESS